MINSSFALSTQKQFLRRIDRRFNDYFDEDEMYDEVEHIKEELHHQHHHQGLHRQMSHHMHDQDGVWSLIDFQKKIVKGFLKCKIRQWCCCLTNVLQPPYYHHFTTPQHHHVTYQAVNINVHLCICGPIAPVSCWLICYTKNLIPKCWCFQM